MTVPVDRAARGRSARNRGAKAERDLAAYLRQWWPQAERAVITGWRTADRESPDHGDIRGTPGIVWQLKATKDFRLEPAMAQTVKQSIAAGSDFGVLVQRRDGHADPGRWWAWVQVSDIGRLLAGDVLAPWGVSITTLYAPVRLELRHVVALLIADGYAEPPAESA